MSSAVVAVAFDPDDSKTLVTCGKEHIHFWRLHNTRLERKSGFSEVQYWHYSCMISSSPLKKQKCDWAKLTFLPETTLIQGWGIYSLQKELNDKCIRNCC